MVLDSRLPASAVVNTNLSCQDILYSSPPILPEITPQVLLTQNNFLLCKPWKLCTAEHFCELALFLEVIYKLCSDCSLVPDILLPTRPCLMYFNKEMNFYPQEYDSATNFVMHSLDLRCLLCPAVVISKWFCFPFCS